MNIEDPHWLTFGVQVTAGGGHWLCIMRSSCCSNIALVSVMVVTNSYLRSWIKSPRWVGVGLGLFCSWWFAVLSISLGGGCSALTEAMAVLNWATTLAIINLKALISIFIDWSSVAYAGLEFWVVAIVCGKLLWSGGRGCGISSCGCSFSWNI